MCRRLGGRERGASIVERPVGVLGIGPPRTSNLRSLLLRDKRFVKGNQRDRMIGTNLWRRFKKGGTKNFGRMREHAFDRRDAGPDIARATGFGDRRLGDLGRAAFVRDGQRQSRRDRLQRDQPNGSESEPWISASALAMIVAKRERSKIGAQLPSNRPQLQVRFDDRQSDIGVTSPATRLRSFIQLPLFGLEWPTVCY